MDNWYFLFGAYTIAWLGVAVFIFLNTKKLKAVEKKIEDLESFLEHKE